MTRPRLTLSGIVLGAPDPRALAAFYEQLLGYERRDDGPTWVTTVPPGGGPGLSFQTESEHVAPRWPSGAGDQQMQVHLDIAVADVDEAGDHARAAGATLAEFQPQDDVRVWIDPAGHPSCLYAGD